MQPDQNILQINNISKYFGGLAAVSNCSLNIKKGSITGVIGPNGSGKTTLFNLIAGNLKPNSGKVIFNKEEITSIPSYELFSKGLLRTFQIAHEFTNLTVLENLMFAGSNVSNDSLFQSFMQLSKQKKYENSLKEEAMKVMKDLNIEQMSDSYARELSGGQKKLLELGRSIIKKPEVLLLDEPLAGVNPKLAEDLLDIIQNLSNQGITILMVEHNIEAVMKISERVVVLAEGALIADGPPQEVRENQKVIEAYLGTGDE